MHLNKIYSLANKRGDISKEKKASCPEVVSSPAHRIQLSSRGGWQLGPDSNKDWFFGDLNPTVFSKGIWSSVKSVIFGWTIWRVYRKATSRDRPSSPKSYEHAEVFCCPLLVEQSMASEVPLFILQTHHCPFWLKQTVHLPYASL